MNQNSSKDVENLAQEMQIDEEMDVKLLSKMFQWSQEEPGNKKTKQTNEIFISLLQLLLPTVFCQLSRARQNCVRSRVSSEVKRLEAVVVGIASVRKGRKVRLCL